MYSIYIYLLLLRPLPSLHHLMLPPPPPCALFFTSDQGTRSKLIQGLENVFKNHLDAFVQHLDVLEVVMCF